MKAIRQLYDIKMCTRSDSNWSDMTNIILQALGGMKGYRHKRIVDDGESMVNLYRDMSADFFLVVISTDMNKQQRGMHVNRYCVKPLIDNAKDYIYSGTLIKELMKEHRIQSNITLAELKEVLSEWQK
jgi:hypothetical protein